MVLPCTATPVVWWGVGGNHPGWLLGTLQMKAAPGAASTMPSPACPAPCGSALLYNDAPEHSTEPEHNSSKQAVCHTSATTISVAMHGGSTEGHSVTIDEAAMTDRPLCTILSVRLITGDAALVSIHTALTLKQVWCCRVTNEPLLHQTKVHAPSSSTGTQQHRMKVDTASSSTVKASYHCSCQLLRQSVIVVIQRLCKLPLQSRSFFQWVRLPFLFSQVVHNLFQLP